MKEIKYQQKYVRQLVDMTIDLLRLTGHRKTLIFKAPTGSGKTVMASQMLADLTDMANGKQSESRAADIIKNWIRTRYTIEFLGT